LDAVLKNNISKLTNSFIVLLVKKGRESDLQEIANTFIAQYNSMKGIHEVTLTTAVEISTEMKNSIEQKVKSDNKFEGIALTTKTDESLIGGFVLEFNNNLLDASILRDLKDIKKQFLKNEFVGKI
jgi:F-type H+-transporting ATPase subunit delta